MNAPRVLAAVALLAVAAGGCKSPDYGDARRTRNDRPYRGGASAVAETPPARAEKPHSAAEGWAWLATLVIGFTHGIDGRNPEWTPAQTNVPPPSR